MSQQFKAATLSKKFKKICGAFDNLLAKSDSSDLKKLRKNLREAWKRYEEQGVLTVAFVGEYSAGKSTIISALTGRRDINIDSDIATDATTSYDWNGIQVIDTPGLFTDRADHDKKTYEAIAKADLLVFCLTHMLFDTVTVENFKKLAYEKEYRWKIMMVVNKMSAAAGDEDQKIASYIDSLGEALKPYHLKEFPLCFIDAKDYCEGVDDDDDDFLVECSRFDSFIHELNLFVERRASLTRLDTPIRMVLSCLDEAQIGFARNSHEDTAFLEVLSRLSRTINKERERLRTKIKTIILDLSHVIVEEGSRLASAVGEPHFQDFNQEAENNIRKHYENAGILVENTTNEAIKSIHQEIKKELQSNLTQAFVAQINFNTELNNFESPTSFDRQKTEQIKEQVQQLQNWGQKVGTQVTRSATKNAVDAVGQGLLRSKDVAGSTLHQGVLQAGKFIGFKFKPWQAVGMAKNLGNAAMFLGPALAVISVGMDLHAMHKEREHEKAMSDIRRDITSQFKTITIDLKQQIESQLQEFEENIYGQFDEEINAARQETTSAMETSNSDLGLIAKIRDALNAILQNIQVTAKEQI